MGFDEPIHVTIPGSPADPRTPDHLEGIVIHRVPHLHPDDVSVVDGLPVTSVARTLVDLAEVMTQTELRATFANAEERGLLDLGAVRASASRVEWRPSLAMLYAVVQEFAERN